jgi:hypothetical protein
MEEKGRQRAAALEAERREKFEQQRIREERLRAEVEVTRNAERQRRQGLVSWGEACVLGDSGQLRPW